MTTPLSDERIAEIRERCDKATPGPWSVDEESGDVWVPSIWRSVAIIEDLDLPLVNPAADRAFIAAARTDMPDLLDEVERLRALVPDLNAALVAKQQEGDRLAGDYVAIRAENQSLRDHHYSLDACPECGRLPPDHALDCALDAALRGAGG